MSFTTDLPWTKENLELLADVLNYFQTEGYLVENTHPLPAPRGGRVTCDLEENMKR